MTAPRFKAGKEQKQATLEGQAGIISLHSSASYLNPTHSHAAASSLSHGLFLGTTTELQARHGAEEKGRAPLSPTGSILPPRPNGAGSQRRRGAARPGRPRTARRPLAHLERLKPHEARLALLVLEDEEGPPILIERQGPHGRHGCRCLPHTGRPRAGSCRARRAVT